MRVTVVIDSKSPALAGGLTYASEQPLQPGDLVEVPLRKSTAEGIVWECDAAPIDAAVRRIERVLQRGFVDAPLMDTARWLTERFAVSPRLAIGTVLPSPPWGALKSTSMYARALPKAGEPRGPKQQAALAALRTAANWVEEESLDATSAVLKALHDGGWIERTLRGEEEQPAPSEHPTPIIPHLVRGGACEQRNNAAWDAIAQELSGGKRVIILAPERAAAEHWAHSAHERFPERSIALLHSDAPKQRTMWKAARSADIVVGTRSAAFAPVAPLGLIVLDDEEDWGFKSERTPRFHARDVAMVRAQASGAAVLLLSAAPSSETWLKEERGHLTAQVLPPPQRSVTIIDAGTVAWGNHYPLSPTLLLGMEKALNAGQRCALFFNRKGIATSVLCLQCRRRLLSPVNQLPLVLHRSLAGTPELKDHATGERSPIPALCPHCGAPNLRPVGAGTQRLEDLVKARFPGISIASIAASGTIGDPATAQVVIGTQAIVHAGVLEQCALVAVVLADIGLSLPHYRAGERVVHTLAHIRDALPPAASLIVQTFRPDAPEIAWLPSGDNAAYFKAELAFRTQLGFPPAIPLTYLLPRNRPVPELADALERRARELGISATIVQEKDFKGNDRVAIRSTETDALLAGADLSTTVVDRDPLW